MANGFKRRFEWETDARPGSGRVSLTIPGGTQWNPWNSSWSRSAWSHFFSGRMRLDIVGGNLTEQMGNFLGVPGKRGILIMEVRPNSAADHSGLKAGDVIKSVDGPGRC